MIITKGVDEDAKNNGSQTPLYLAAIGLPLFLVPFVMRVYHTYSPCLEEGGA